MVEIADINDTESLSTWLIDQPHEVGVWLASRAAARALPQWWHPVLMDVPPKSFAWRKRRKLTPNLALRALFYSFCYAKFSTDYFEIMASNAGIKITNNIKLVKRRNFSNSAQDAVLAAASIGLACQRSSDASNESPKLAVNFSTKNLPAAESWEAIRADAEAVREGSVPYAMRLWPNGPGPLADNWVDIKSRVVKASDAADWQFWLEWYDALLEGRTMLNHHERTWDMLEKIARINLNTWDAGPTAVNPEIRKIWELHRLRAECAALQAEKDAFLAARASEAQRSHNQPPEGLVDDYPEVARQITIVWDSLDEARDELEQDTPDKGVLRRIAEKLFSALTAIAKYCGKVADTAIMSAAEGAGKEAGKLGVRAAGITVLDHVLNNGRLTQFAKDLLTYASGG